MNWRADDGTVHEKCVVFARASDEFGGLSNMTGAYRLLVNRVEVGSSEALYQACRFPHQPDWQKEIITQASPMAAKMKAKKEGRRQNVVRQGVLECGEFIFFFSRRGCCGLGCRRAALGRDKRAHAAPLAPGLFHML